MDKINNYKKFVLSSQLYQGSNKDNYFEGWYFKHVTEDKNTSISFIIGISKNKDDSHSFIQVIDNIENMSYYYRYNIEAFKYNDNPFYIELAGNYFSFNEIIIDLNNIIGHIKYDQLLPIKKSLYSPNIMGPFGYLNFMECNHAIISLRHKLKGYINIYNKKILFDDGLGYIEKDFGTSFPSKYIWLEGNNNNNSMFMSYATIPFKGLSFKGLICILEIEGKQYRFATYLLGKIKNIKYEKKDNDDTYNIVIKQLCYELNIKLISYTKMKLISPNNGEMSDTIYESLNSKAKVRLLKRNKLIYEGDYNSCGSEVVF